MKKTRIGCWSDRSSDFHALGVSLGDYVMRTRVFVSAGARRSFKFKIQSWLR
jgi:hypothetical protein